MKQEETRPNLESDVCLSGGTLAGLTDLKAFGIGHAQSKEAGTGCTVVVAPKGATCGVDVRGGGPATRETDLLKPENMIEQVHAVVLSGGSAFGLEASCGVMDTLAERRIGFELGGAYVPIVVGACLFDLLVGKPEYPNKTMGAQAAEAALAQWEAKQLGKNVSDLKQGNVGAGTGATVGKLLAPEAAMKSGFGYACTKANDLVVAALVAVNALGHVCDTQGNWIAGCLHEGTKVLSPEEAIRLSTFASLSESTPCTNTTIGVVLTNAKLTKAQATKIASTTHDAYARAIKPVHTSNDGDTIFTFASGEVESMPDTVAFLAAEAMQQAIINAVTNAQGAYGLKAPCDLLP